MGDNKQVMVTFNGCWQIFPRPLVCLSAIEAVEMVMCAINNGNSNAIITIFAFFNGDIPIREIQSSVLVKILHCCNKWRLKSVTYVEDNAAVLIDVFHYSFVVFTLKIKNGCWIISEMFATNINDILDRTAYF